MNNLKSLATKYFGLASAIFFFAGFVWDYFMAPSILEPLAIHLSGGYFLMLTILIYLKEVRLKNNIYFKLFVSFALGFYASLIFIYYIRGGDILVNLPILFILFFFMFANEFVKNKYRKLVELSSFSITTIFYFIFIIPVIVKSLSDMQFYIALFSSFVFLFFYLKFIFDKDEELKRYRLHYYIISPILLLALAFYLKLLPAVPLSLHYSGFYKSINSNLDNAGVRYYDFNSKINRDIMSLGVRKIKKEDLIDNKVYYYSEVEAPTNLNTIITHTWDKYDEKSSKWVNISKVSYPAVGGREGGYRGYSFINVNSEGKYRVSVIINGSRYIGSAKIIIE